MNNGPEDLKFEEPAGPSTSPAELTVGQASALAAAPIDNSIDDPQLEAALRQVLQPEFPPVGFADRLMARALAGDRALPLGNRPVLLEGGEPEGKLLRWPDRRLWISGLIAAVLVAGILEGGVTVRRVREQQRRIVQATQQFQTTERVTVHALAQAREQLQRAGVPLSLD